MPSRPNVQPRFCKELGTLDTVGRQAVGKLASSLAAAVHSASRREGRATFWNVAPALVPSGVDLAHCPAWGEGPVLS